MFKYNKNVKKRDEFLFHGYNPDNYKFGGICDFSNLDAKDIKYLLDMKFIDPDECQNCSPTTLEIYEFIKKHPNFYAFGYAVSPDREDYRITLVGIYSNKDVSKEELMDFVEFAHYADELDVRPKCRAWWD